MPESNTDSVSEALPIELARREVKRLSNGWFKHTLDFLEAERDGLTLLQRIECDLLGPSHLAIAAQTGAAKTTSAIEGTAWFVKEAERRGLPDRVLYVVRTLDLADEIAAKLRAHGLSVAVFHGRNQPDPQQPNQSMCLNPGAVEAAIAQAYRVERAACKSDNRECALYRLCAYQQQKRELAHAKVVVCAHEWLFRRLPAEAGAFAATIIEESFAATGLITEYIKLADLKNDLVRWPVLRRGIPDHASTARLRRLRQLLFDALMLMRSEGCAVPNAMRQVGLTAEDCSRAAKLERRRAVAGLVEPGMSRSDSAAASVQKTANRSIRLYVKLWEECARFEHTGRIQVSEKSVWLHQRRLLRREIADRPILVLDATAQLEILQHYLEFCEVKRISVDAPNQRIHRYLGSFGKVALFNPELTARLRERVAQLSGGESAVTITHMDVEPAFDGLPNMATAHFNAMRGLNKWEQVRFAFVIGRPLPRDREMNRLVRCLTGEDLPFQRLGWVCRSIPLKNGRHRTVQARGYSHPAFAAMQAELTDAEVIHAIGRARCQPHHR